MEAPPVIAPTRRHSAWWLAGACVCAAIAVVLFEFNPSHYGFYPRCWLYTTTGIYCPGCGSLRAMHQLTHGHLAAALRCNLLLTLSVPFVAIFAIRCAWCWTAGKPLPSMAIRPGWIMALAVILILFTILRNIHVAPFTYLAPP
jgi:hypothetical protein